MERMKLPYNQRLCISIEEAAEYSMIGENRLRTIIDNDKYGNTLDWVLHTGNRIRIKRPLFEKWVLQQSYL
ncbi:excisionase [Anaerostipes sp.]|uniref:excisionase n=1 Tax=Anaerostipes sp. TaxID=1872530 RepID=UPI0039675985